jgi:hypothetical protein
MHSGRLPDDDKIIVLENHFRAPPGLRKIERNHA